MNLHKITGIVVKKYDRPNGDREIQIVSEFDSVFKMLAKGIRKSKRREIYATDLMSKSEFLCYSSGIISKLELIDGFTNLKSQLLKINYSLYMLSIFNELFLEGEIFKRVYNLLEGSLKAIENTNNIIIIKTTILNFLVSVINYQGLMPGDFNFNVSSDIMSCEDAKIEISNMDEKISFLEGYLNKNIGLKTNFDSFMKGIV